MRRAVVGLVGLLLVVLGFAGDRALLMLVGPVVRALHDPERLALLNDLVFRARDTFGPDHYAQVVLRRLRAISPVVIVVGVAAVITSLRARPDVAAAIDRTLAWVAAGPARLGALMIALATVVRANTILRPSTLNWDEDTFLTVAQRLAVGELPFVTTLDNKPPLFPLQQAIPFVLGFDAPWQIRLSLAVLVGLTAAVVGWTVRSLGGGAAGAVLGGALLVVGVSIAPFGGGSMSHHHPNLLLALLLLVAVRRARMRSHRSDVLLGVLAAAVTLTRTNYAVPAALVLLAVLAGTPRRDRVRTVIDAAIGGVSVLALVVLPYAATGTLDNLRYGVVDTLFGPGGRAAGALSLATAPGWLWPLALLQGGLVLIAARTRLRGGGPGPDVERGGHRPSALPAVAFIGMLVSLALHDSIWDHYAGMLMVPLAIQAGLASAPRPGRLLAAVTGAAAVVAGLALTWTGSAGVVPSPEVTARVALEDEAVDRLGQLLERRPGGVWTLDHNFVLWRLEAPPALPEYIHPSTITLQAFRSGVPLFRSGPVPRSTWEAVGAALDTGPRYIVSSRGLDEGYLVAELTPDQLVALRARVERDYDLAWASTDGRVAIRACRACP